MPWVNVPTLVLIVLTELSPSIKWTIEKKWLQGTLLISNANRMWDWTTTTPTTTADRYGASYKHGLINGCDVRQSAIAFGQPGQPGHETHVHTHSIGCRLPSTRKYVHRNMVHISIIIIHLSGHNNIITTHGCAVPKRVSCKSVFNWMPLEDCLMEMQLIAQLLVDSADFLRSKISPSSPTIIFTTTIGRSRGTA